MKTPRGLLCRFALFGVLGLTDLALTCFLLRTERGHVYESNPVAQWWLAHWGWAGLAGFKLGALLLVIPAAKLIGRHRPRTAARVLNFACGATALVVGYSCTLLGTARMQGVALTREDEVRIETEAVQLDAQVQELQAYYQLRDQLAEELNAGRGSLEALVTRLQATPKARDPAWLKLLRRAHPAGSDRECLAALIVSQARLRAEVHAEARSAEAGAGHPDKPPTVVAGGSRLSAAIE